MPTASKSADIIRMEGKSHRTKKELRQREQAEKALLTGIPLKERQEVKDNEIAHKEFLRLKKLLEKINKFDDMYGAVINRYCILYAETKEFEEKRDQFYKQLCEFQNEKDDMLINRELTRKGYTPDRVINGTFGELWIDAEYMAETIALEAKMKFDTAEVTQSGTLKKGYKITGISGSGTVKLNKVTSYWLKRAAQKQEPLQMRLSPYPGLKLRRKK